MMFTTLIFMLSHLSHFNNVLSISEGGQHNLIPRVFRLSGQRGNALPHRPKSQKTLGTRLRSTKLSEDVSESQKLRHFMFRQSSKGDVRSHEACIQK